MTKSNFLTLFILLNIAFLFIKIYQHNQIVKLNYEKQRLENKTIELRKERNKQLITLHKLKNPRRIKKIAQNKLGMQQLRLSQITKGNIKKQYDSTNTLSQAE